MAGTVHDVPVCTAASNDRTSRRCWCQPAARIIRTSLADVCKDSLRSGPGLTHRSGVPCRDLCGQAVSLALQTTTGRGAMPSWCWHRLEISLWLGRGQAADGLILRCHKERRRTEILWCFVLRLPFASGAKRRVLPFRCVSADLQLATRTIEPGF